MSQPAIRVTDLGKQYRIGAARQQRPDTLRDALTGALRGLARRQPARDDSTLWALRDVCFEVQPGEVVGVIGRNGAGKSTLLKILARITEPTTGEVEIRGRVGSLLEVGTGFHPELTGRENVFLNGAILGMRRREIQRKFDEIVAFAEVEKFIDMPVKHYSSGMYVRLAFAVAAHLDPDILFVDEVLAVGDLGFQQKCLDHIALQTAQCGITTLIVSHNLGTIRELCRKAVWLNRGQSFAVGTVEAVAREYIRSLDTIAHSAIRAARLYKSHEATIFDCWCEVGQVRTAQWHIPDVLSVRLTIDVHVQCILSVAVILKTARGQPVALAQVGLTRGRPIDVRPGRYQADLKMPRIDLAGGRYTLDVSIGEPNRKFFDYLENALSLEVVSAVDPITGWCFQEATGQGAVLLDCELIIE